MIRKIRTLMGLLLLGAVCANANQMYYYLTQDNTATKTTNTMPSTAYKTRLIIQITPVYSETQETIIPKPEWVYMAQQVYTNGLTTLGMRGVWTNMDYTFEMVGANILQAMGENMAVGNMDAVNNISIWKGLIKDTYETLYKYGANYGITDMRLFPYDSPYIYSNSVLRQYIEYDGDKYYLGD